MIAWIMSHPELILFFFGAIEAFVGALPNDKVPYRSAILKLCAYLDAYETKRHTSRRPESAP